MSTNNAHPTDDQADQPVSPPAAPPAANNPAEPSRLAEQLRLSENYRNEAQRQMNLHRATVGHLTANLLEIEARLSGVIRQSLATDAHTMTDIEAYRGPIDQEVRIVKQVVQLEQLQMNLKKSESISVPGRTW